MKLGEIIHNYRVENRMTMQDFAVKANLSKGYISMLEKNQHPQSQRKLTPSFETYQKVAVAMGITIDDLVLLLDENEPVKLHSPSSPEPSRESTAAQRSYYINSEVAELAQEIYNNPELRVLFDATRNVSKEDLQLVVDMTKRLKGSGDE